MNKLKGKIVALETIDQFSKVKLEVGSETFVSIVIAVSTINPILTIGHNVHLLFKETDVTISKVMPELISIANKIPVIIKSKQVGKLLTRLKLDFDEYTINAVVPSDFAAKLNIEETVVMMVRSNEIMLMH